MMTGEKSQKRVFVVDDAAIQEVLAHHMVHDAGYEPMVLDILSTYA